jgi:hypothetical protein
MYYFTRHMFFFFFHDFAGTFPLSRFFEGDVDGPIDKSGLIHLLHCSDINGAFVSFGDHNVGFCLPLSPRT